MDLAHRTAIDDIEERLSRLNPSASRRSVVQGAVTPDEIFGETVYDPAQRIVDVARWLHAEQVAAAEGAPVTAAGRHESRIATFCLSFLQPFEWREVAAWLDALAKARGEDLLRVKGIVNVVDAEGPVVVHAVQHLFHPPLTLERWPTPLKRTQIVFITRDLSRDYVLEVLAAVRDAQAERPSTPEPFHPASA